jgi:hypothetical protein
MFLDLLELLMVSLGPHVSALCLVDHAPPVEDVFQGNEDSANGGGANSYQTTPGTPDSITKVYNSVPVLQLLVGRVCILEVHYIPAEGTVPVLQLLVGRVCIFISALQTS